MIDLVSSFVFTWVIGLTPSLLLRFVFMKKALRKRYAIPIVFTFWIIHSLASVIIKDLAGTIDSPSPVLGVVAVVSYFILTNKHERKN